MHIFAPLYLGPVKRAVATLDFATLLGSFSWSFYLHYDKDKGQYIVVQLGLDKAVAYNIAVAVDVAYNIAITWL